MSLFSLQNVRNHPRRSAFDLSSKVAFSAKAGELLPIKWCFTMPGDKFSLKHQHFTRTQPVNTSAYTRIREYYDWFWCPLHLLWRNAPEVIQQIQSNVQHAASFTSAVDLGNGLPSFSISDLSDAITALDSRSAPNNFFGYNRADLAYKLLQYLRYGNCNHSTKRNYGTSLDSTDYSQDFIWTLGVSIFPLLAYKKFCQDYFRYTQWQDSAPYLWNIDYYNGTAGELTIPVPSSSYWQGNTLFDLEYANWNKDMFLGILPDAQYGDTALVDIGYGNTGYKPITKDVMTSGSSTALTFGNGDPSKPQFGSVPANTSLTLDVLALRRGEALQRWKEISLNTPLNYRSQIKAHFGVDVGENMSGMSTYIGGSSSNLDISEVVNSNITETNEANIAGKGVGTGSSREFFECKDWGVLMCMYHAVPLLDYILSAPDPQLFAVTNTDFPVPELDSIGLQSIPVSQYTNNPLEVTGTGWDSYTSASRAVGYLPRYYAWKTSLDYVLGAFTTTEKEWVAPITTDIWKNMLKTFTPNATSPVYSFFKVNPAVLNSIFKANVDSFWDTDQFLINCALDIRVVRNLDYSGMPY